MKIKLYLIYFALIHSINSSQAEVKTETVCYGYQPKNRSAEYYGVLLRTCYDTELQREIGSFVQYNKNSHIPLVFDKKIDTDLDDPELGNFELRRLEILGGQITGTYLLVQNGTGVKKGKYLEYRNRRTGASSIFFEIGEENACLEVCASGRCRFQPEPNR